ncbi:hypothetical protein PR202_gb29653 [Eleusine coracana subsp. coracana]|uniref:Uncharacterized protein n=1 Tax=Eleusine coracana subsp. coracana TaxID=191504 RepID=A0AAV5G269_ELECO|nr:hypothetical protein PR202_gb29653 [Eleusine coracana subsp. coracana]
MDGGAHSEAIEKKRQGNGSQYAVGSVLYLLLVSDNTLFLGSNSTVKKLLGQSKKAVDAILGHPVDGSSATASDDPLLDPKKPKPSESKKAGADTGAIPGHKLMQLAISKGKLNLDETTDGSVATGSDESLVTSYTSCLAGGFFCDLGGDKGSNSDTEGLQVDCVFLDSEFCRRGRSFESGEPSSTDGHCAQTKKTVNGGDLVQVGLLITHKSSFQVVGNGCYEFNLRFDASSRPESEVEFLRSHLKLLGDHAARGIPLDMFASLLRSSGLTSNGRVTWVTFQAYNDYGYLIRALECTEVLPDKREDFLRLVLEHFPSSYDLKVFHRPGICCVKAVKPCNFHYGLL